MDRAWFDAVSRFLGGWPDDYLVVDTETTGLRPESHLIVELGWVEVHDRRIADSGSILLDWSREHCVDFDRVACDLATVRQRMAARGESYRIDAALLKREGVAPAPALAEFVALMTTCHESGMALVGHNVWPFDRLFFQKAMAVFGSRPWLMPPGRLWDTGLLEKARQLTLHPADDVGRYYDAVARDRRSVRYSLGKHCAEVYRLDVDATRTHSTAYDCEITHHLLEAMRSQAGGGSRVSAPVHVPLALPADPVAADLGLATGPGPGPGAALAT
jgi:DNA polymerase III epsilon subunit-like protein